MVTTLGTTLKQLRQDKDYTQHYVSRNTGISEKQISRIERGKRSKRPHNETIEKLAECYEVDSKMLFDLLPTSKQNKPEEGKYYFNRILKGYEVIDVLSNNHINYRYDYSSFLDSREKFQTMMNFFRKVSEFLEEYRKRIKDRIRHPSYRQYELELDEELATLRGLNVGIFGKTYLVMLDDFRTEQPPYDTKVVWTHYALFSLPTDGNYNITTVKHDQADYPREYAILGERFVFPYGKNYPGRSYKVVHTNKPLYAIPEKQKISELQGKMGEAECIGVALFFKEELSEEERERFESDEFFGYERYQIIEEQDLRGNPLKKISQAEHHDVYYDLQIGEYSLSDTPDIFSGDDPEVRRPKLMERVYEEYNHQLIQFGKDHARMIWMAFLTKEKYTAGLEDDISDYKRNPYFIEYLNQTAEWIKPEDAKKQLQLEEEGDKNES